ncbi:hypothetical protein ZOSMA_490G00030 [Zostera marina]|uniref:Protein kinase domain-containing protein n=1 Tax=Zostera marina TaxID=29655 RepID=A0A0K9P1H5_ZOSMR|nr:hypothetical protein ZOSMA_490G00030 [Zostera marina]
MKILIFFIFVSSLFFHGGIAATTDYQTDPIEVEALNAILIENWKIPFKGNNTDIFYNSTYGNYYNETRYWDINATNPCTGFIVDDSEDQRVYDNISSKGKLDILCSCAKNNSSTCNIIRLSAWNLNIFGTIPVEIQNLKKLVFLDLDSNSLNGQLPAFLGTLSEMKFMYLSANNFNGLLPSEIENLKNIQKLYLSHNNFEGEILNSLGNLTKLKILDLEDNSFQGSIPSSIVNLVDLEELDLSRNSFSSHLPQEIGNLKKLRELDLSGNNFTGSIPNNLIQRERLGLLNMSLQGNPDLCFDDQCEKSSSNKTTIIIIAVICSTIAVFSVIIFIGWKVKRIARNTLSEEPLRGGPLQSTVPGIHTSNKEFTYLDLVIMTKNFNKIIGKGGFGNVYYGIDQRNGSEVAVKMLSNSSIQGSKEFQMEAQILSRIHHKNFVSLVGYCTETGHLALVYEYMKGGNLRNLISGQCNSSTTISWRDRMRMGLEIAQGLIELFTSRMSTDNSSSRCEDN